MSNNPALKMGKVRQQVWLTHADPDDFFEMITMLTKLYAKKIYKSDLGYNPSQLLTDYPEYLKRKVKGIKHTNNVPFLSSSDAPGSYVEEPPKSQTAMDEINKLINEL